MSQDNPRLLQALDFILNKATEPEISVLKEAIERRTGSSTERNLPDIDFAAMAKKMTADLQGRFEAPGDINPMTRRMVANMIYQQEPGISEEELEILLDRFVPDPAKLKMGREKELPRDVILSMLRQFVSYSLGAMPEAEKKELIRLRQDWAAAYWDAFSQDTQLLVREFLRGGLDEKEFWTRVYRHFESL